jgi:hypothetical protein
MVFGFCLCLMVAFALLGSDLLVDYFGPPESRTPSAGTTEAATGPPEPRLQTDPSQDLARMRHAEDARLQSYGWIDRQTGAVHIPIARAMDLLAAQHLGPVAASSNASDRRSGQSGR